MKLKVFKKSEKDEEKKVYLELVEKIGYISLQVVNEEAEPVICGHLLEIYPDGVRLLGSVSHTLGFPLDDKDRLKILDSYPQNEAE